MTKLPRVSGQNCVSALLKAGFRIKRQHGSHIILRRDHPFAQVVVPDHAELDTGTLRAILRQASLSPDDFRELL
ncbi:MAG: type II toxin-antitoxin system HicA family toxin [Candidatus Acidiferrum sp.]